MDTIIYWLIIISSLVLGFSSLFVGYLRLRYDTSKKENQLHDALHWYNELTKEIDDRTQIKFKKEGSL